MEGCHLIDVSKCEFEESRDLSDVIEEQTFFYSYPFDLNEAQFTFDNCYYNKIISMCIALTMFDAHSIELHSMMISPIIHGGNAIGWVELLPNINYTIDDVDRLLNKAGENAWY